MILQFRLVGRTARRTSLLEAPGFSAAEAPHLQGAGEERFRRSWRKSGRLAALSSVRGLHSKLPGRSLTLAKLLASAFSGRGTRSASSSPNYFLANKSRNLIANPCRVERSSTYRLSATSAFLIANRSTVQRFLWPPAVIFAAARVCRSLMLPLEVAARDRGITTHSKGGTVNRPLTQVSHAKQRVGQMQGRNVPVHPILLQIARPAASRTADSSPISATLRGQETLLATPWLATLSRPVYDSAQNPSV